MTDDFHKTRMGQEYYGRALPRLVAALERIAELLEKLVKEQGPSHDPKDR